MNKLLEDFGRNFNESFSVVGEWSLDLTFQDSRNGNHLKRRTSVLNKIKLGVYEVEVKKETVYEIEKYLAQFKLDKFVVAPQKPANDKKGYMTNMGGKYLCPSHIKRGLGLSEILLYTDFGAKFPDVQFSIHTCLHVRAYLERRTSEYISDWIAQCYHGYSRAQVEIYNSKQVSEQTMDDIHAYLDGFSRNELDTYSESFELSDGHTQHYYDFTDEA